MSNKKIPLYLRDVNNPPPYLKSSQQQSWIKAAEKAKLNHQYQQQYPPFHVPETMYQVMYINKYTTNDTMKLLIEHAEECSEYSVDTEGEKSINETALIQIESIPRKLPKYIIILELAHLPSNHSSSKVMIKKLLQLIFRYDNKIYSWGNLAQELSNVTQKDLLCPLKADQYDVQDLFSSWYLWARSQCGGCDRSNDKQCHQPSPYQLKEKWSLQRALIYVGNVFIDKSITVNHWSLLLDPAHSTLSKTTHEQRIYYLINDCLATTYLSKAVVEYWTFDKLKKTNFTELFTSSSTRSSIINNNNIRITIKNNSTITKKIKNNIDGQMFKNALDYDLEPISDESDLEQISDEEIQLNKLTEPNVIMNDIINDEEPMEQIQQQQHEQDQIDVIMMGGSVNNHQVVVDVQEDPIDIDYIPVINDGEPSEPIQQQQLNDIESITNEENRFGEHHDNEEIKTNEALEEFPLKRRNRPHRERTQASRKRKNKKRNRTRRISRYRHYVAQPLYDKYSMPLVRKVLDEYNIDYVHIKGEDGYLVVGLKNKWIKKQYNRQIPEDLFDGRNYQRHYQRYRRQRRTDK